MAGELALGSQVWVPLSSTFHCFSVVHLGCQTAQDKYAKDKLLEGSKTEAGSAREEQQVMDTALQNRRNIYTDSYVYTYIYTLLKYSRLTMFRGHSKVIQLHRYTYIIFEVIFYHRLLQDIDYSSLCYTANLCCCTSNFYLEI